MSVVKSSNQLCLESLEFLAWAFLIYGNSSEKEGTNFVVPKKNRVQIIFPRFQFLIKAYFPLPVSSLQCRKTESYIDCCYVQCR